MTVWGDDGNRSQPWSDNSSLSVALSAAGI